LIVSLINNGDLFNAERFAQQTYANLRDRKNKIDQEGEEVANGAHNLADVIHRQNRDLIKAEELARHAIRIRSQVFFSNHPFVGSSWGLLARILPAQKKFGDDTKELFECNLPISIRQQGPDGPYTAVTNSNFGQFYVKLPSVQSEVDKKQRHLLLAQSYFEEAVRIELKIYGPTHPSTIDATSRLSASNELLSR
jgi:hypothetical protein